MKFTYERFPPDDDPVYFPTLIVTIVNPKTEGSYNCKVLIDSGAAGCVFHAFIGETIGIAVRGGEKYPLSGVTEGKGEQFIHEILLIIGGQDYKLNVGFSYDLRFPFSILGQKGFFEQNRICYDLPVGDFEITPKTRKRN
jgi:hypothetical protein